MLSFLPSKSDREWHKKWRKREPRARVSKSFVARLILAPMVFYLVVLGATFLTQPINVIVMVGAAIMLVGSLWKSAIEYDKFIARFRVEQGWLDATYDPDSDHKVSHVHGDLS